MDELTPPQDPRLCPWMDNQRLTAEGGVFVWRADDQEAAATLATMQQRFGTLELAGVVEVSYRGQATPTRVGLAIVPPASTSHITKLPANPVR